MEKIKRQPNFTADEIEVIVCGVEKNNKVLCGKFSGVVTAAAKSKAWAELAKEVSAVSGVYRTGTEVMKKWKGLKSGAKHCAVNIRKSMSATGGGDGIGMLDNSQQRILGVIGSVCVDGITGGVDTASPQEIAASTSVDTLISEVAVSVSNNKDLPLPMQLVSNDVPESSVTHKRKTIQDVWELQKNTLQAVNELLEVERERLAVEKESLEIKKAKLALMGCYQREDGAWVRVVPVVENSSAAVGTEE